jgi:hypothetical protein
MNFVRYFIITCIAINMATLEIVITKSIDLLT